LGNKKSEQAKIFSSKIPGTTFLVSDLLETYAIEKKRIKGSDLAHELVMVLNEF
jgi:hypothetical protein